MDILYDAAQAYSRLIGTKYSIVLGYKQRAINLILNFYKDNFYHLAGLHNFKDIDALSARPEAVYKKILSKNIDKLHIVAGILLEKEKIDGDEFDKVFEE